MLLNCTIIKICTNIKDLHGTDNGNPGRSPYLWAKK
jgi:hypothetical protein